MVASTGGHALKARPIPLLTPSTLPLHRLKFTGYEFGFAELAENTSVAEPLQLFQCQKPKFPATSSI